MKVPYSYLPQQFADPEPVLAALRRTLLKHQQYTFGPELEEFEKKMAGYVGARHCLGTSSGTMSLSLLLKAAGVGHDDEVITVSQTFIATVGSIVSVGARPFFVDVLDDFTMDPSCLEDAVTDRTRAIMPVHYSGCPARMDEIRIIADKYELPVIEDACCAIGGRVGGKHVGRFGLGGAFSIHPLKNLNAWGDGGLVVTDSDEVRDRIGLLRNHGFSDGRDRVDVFGFNARLDTIQAVVADWLFPRIDEITDARIAHARRYDEAFGGPEFEGLITLPPRRADARHVYHMYMVLAENRDELLQFLQSRGIEAKVHYPIPVHLQKASLDQPVPFGRTDLSRTEAQCKSLITFPVHQHLDDEQIEYVIDSVGEFYRG
ncbi:MAG TPA: DegT/DnrJ/EryC1/StrS family aminotransferase [bacterium]|nr:DegT/DnrJ/EryC1/StrS family aminotransferase [bacterium]HPQ66314.1 DegT/DnrJ/EryC1/StrS family aminotransferase [bacterium]